MMTLQSKTTASQTRHAVGPLRTYPIDSPRAKARIIVLALLADGQLDPRELRGLAERGVVAELGITTDDFFQVLYDFCSDAARLPKGKGNYLMSPALMETILDEVSDAGERKKLVRLIFDVIRSDGHLADSEAHLIWKALDSWSLRLDAGLEVSWHNTVSRKKRQARSIKVGGANARLPRVATPEVRQGATRAG
ncbi:MAG: TerB family tellurite resistance protein [Rhodocyclaceae bacterium]|nr:TerB family tellurite resistance protein [Rhodocyclaceae bacterium]